MEFGRYYEEFEVGAVYKHWPGRTITEYDNTLFALLSMTKIRCLSMSIMRALRPLGRRPVLDSLIFSLTVGMSVSDTSGKTIANLGYERVVFERAMFAGRLAVRRIRGAGETRIGQQAGSRHRGHRNARATIRTKSG